MAEAPLLFQLHAVSAWLLLAAWPFTRLVHAWSIPVGYLRRSHILYRSRTPEAALRRERARV
jgi:nitrate reductase gamma subunit